MELQNFAHLHRFNLQFVSDGGNLTQAKIGLSVAWVLTAPETPCYWQPTRH
jgi:hypothetical protein